MLEYWKGRDARLNDTGWEDKRYRELLALITQTIDKKQRDTYIKTAEEILLEELPFIPLYYMSSSYMKKENLTGDFMLAGIFVCVEGSRFAHIAGPFFNERFLGSVLFARRCCCHRRRVQIACFGVDRLPLQRRGCGH